MPNFCRKSEKYFSNRPPEYVKPAEAESPAPAPISTVSESARAVFSAAHFSVRSPAYPVRFAQCKKSSFLLIFFAGQMLCEYKLEIERKNVHFKDAYPSFVFPCRLKSALPLKW